MNTCVYADAMLARYGFPEGHPFGTDRQSAFLREAQRQGLLERVCMEKGRTAAADALQRFHGAAYVEFVRQAETMGIDYLDAGDTPVFPDVFDIAAHVVGTALQGLDAIMAGKCLRSFQPIGGLHHAGRDRAAGFCVFSDIGVVIETLRSHYGVKRIGYIDIDVHFGDGVFYAYESDPDLIIVDIHQDPRFFYPGTGFAHETGKGDARGTKLNIPMREGSGDEQFRAVWPQAERHLEKHAPEFLLFQCGADGLDGDPLAGLRYTEATHAHAAGRVAALAGRFAGGRLMAFGGGGYSPANLGNAWSAVLAAMIEPDN